ncbi:MAG: solute carrier family 23 protein [Bacillota bacterium]|nr:solute carrier family 23 protein [Bacillota bacterium]
MGQLEMKTAIPLAIQHVFAMFGATVLVPILTGLNPSVALFTAGLGTLIFHFVTKGQVPVFLGSSFAFIAGIIAVGNSFGLAYATGSMIAVGAVYLLMSFIVSSVGTEKVLKLFPPIVVGPIIMVIGLTLAPVAVDMASANWPLAIFTAVTVVFVSMWAKGFFKLIPLLTGIIAGYVVAAILGIIDFAPVNEAAWLAIPSFMAPQFSISAMLIIVPIALVTIIEHIGDITTNGAVVGKDFMKEPGLNRTLIGDGLATTLAGLFGGPANTTYGENTGVLAITKNYNPAIIRMGAVFAILLSFIGKLGALLQTIPLAVMGGISFILFGMIASVGVKTLVDSAPDLSNLRNSSVVFAVLIVGIVSITGYVNPANNILLIQVSENASLTGLSLAAIVGILLNGVYELFAPKTETEEEEEADFVAKENPNLAK